VNAEWLATGTLLLLIQFHLLGNFTAFYQFEGLIDLFDPLTPTVPYGCSQTGHMATVGITGLIAEV